ncbi:hypothetical protein G3256_14545 [Roseobacter ponti]|uniref:Peptide methionine sulfoxide reductase n=1 Tax=Roseobacter ponti TaxID=1891787 RepID=A0A858T0G0_9RHOB|nr:hypothetical protein [Roseobacter ponti]QJF53241.1 hypothetical protein G3256_14545 [Roseobacter ponti]
MPEALSDFEQALDALPAGSLSGRYHGRRYRAVKSVFNNGRSVKLFAEEAGGNDYISLNFYRLKSGARLYPCEMSRGKVLSFVLGFVPDQSGAA